MKCCFHLARKSRLAYLHRSYFVSIIVCPPEVRPKWLASRGRVVEARAAVRRLYNLQQPTQKEEHRSCPQPQTLEQTHAMVARKEILRPMSKARLLPTNRLEEVGELQISEPPVMPRAPLPLPPPRRPTSPHCRIDDREATCRHWANTNMASAQRGNSNKYDGISTNVDGSDPPYLSWEGQSLFKEIKAEAVEATNENENCDGQQEGEQQWLGLLSHRELPFQMAKSTPEGSAPLTFVGRLIFFARDFALHAADALRKWRPIVSLLSSICTASHSVGGLQVLYWGSMIAEPLLLSPVATDGIIAFSLVLSSAFIAGFAADDRVVGRRSLTVASSTILVTGTLLLAILLIIDARLFWHDVDDTVHDNGSIDDDESQDYTMRISATWKLCLQLLATTAIASCVAGWQALVVSLLPLLVCEATPTVARSRAVAL
jgi:hypothetical protein